MIRTYNFKDNDYNYVTKPEYIGEFRDSRNGVICVNPTCDIQCYLNYIEWLNLHKDQWKTFGYLDLGMMPLAMGPSFYNHVIIDVFSKVSSYIDLPVYQMKPQSMMFLECKLNEDDLWVFKEDVSRITGIEENKLTTEKFIRWCIDSELVKLM